jgi:hypothetical protein
MVPTGLERDGAHIADAPLHQLYQQVPFERHVASSLIAVISVLQLVRERDGAAKQLSRPEASIAPSKRVNTTKTRG